MSASRRPESNSIPPNLASVVGARRGSQSPPPRAEPVGGEDGPVDGFERVGQPRALGVGLGVQPPAPQPPGSVAPQRMSNDEALALVTADMGGWDLAYPTLKPGHWVHVRVKVRWQDLEHSYDSVSAAMLWADSKGGIWGTGIAAWQ